MYTCKECDEKFKKPCEKDIDAGGVRDVGAVRRFELPIINVCPSCLSTNIVRIRT